MKKIKVFLFIIAASLFAACDDAIDIKQPSELLPENTFETVADMQTGLNAVYGAIPGENVIYFTSLFTDEVKLGKSNGGQGTDGELAFQLNNNSGDAASIWVGNYYAINLANRLIAGAANVVPAEGDEETYNTILAQAYYIRAYAHFNLISFFSPDMEDDSALGVILVDYVPTTDMKKPRNTNGEVYALINSDLDFAEANLDDNLVAYAPPTGVSKKVILALRARMASYRGQYQAAFDYATAIGNVTPTTRATYQNTFRENTENAEVLWKLERANVSGVPTGNFSQFWSSVNSTITGSPFFEVATALYNKLLPGDIRRETVIDPTASSVGYAIKPIGKYSKSEGQIFLGDVMVFRKSEMVLLKAEYYASISDFTNVAAQINIIRGRRFSSANNIAVPATQQEAWAAILAERRLELAFEGHRYVDLRRLGEKANVTVDRETSDFTWNGAYTLAIDSFKWTLPIPRSEQAANPGIQQNPGYGEQ
jgi:starch-binding outer membrane protein, SusD/RagB family